MSVIEICFIVHMCLPDSHIYRQSMMLKQPRSISFEIVFNVKKFPDHNHINHIEFRVTSFFKDILN